MAKPTQMRLTRSEITVGAIPSGIRKIEKRITELEGVDEQHHDRLPPDGLANILANEINATMHDVFGLNTMEATEFEVKNSWFYAMVIGANNQDRISAFHRGISRSIQVLQAALKRLDERLEDRPEDVRTKVLRAYEGLELHPEISRAATDLYRDGHYSNAIEDAVKALNALVRLRSGADADGMTLMQSVFSPKKPILSFNNLSDQSDIDEQTGFMMLFSGAVAGLRNPRAHRLMKDDAEQTLEFIAFVSLLAKLLDRTKKIPKS
jgi:uncharacterized protein (TIGR02391 family)